MQKNNEKSTALLRLSTLAMLVALGVIISPILRFEGMCPMAHLINIVCSVFLGPWYSLLCAVTIGVIRMTLLGIPPIALTGAVFGAFLSGVFYRMSKGNILMAVLGEVIGTGIVGAILSYPVMTYFWGKEGLTPLFYVPSFVSGTLIGGSIAYVLLKKLSANGQLSKFQGKLGTVSYGHKDGAIANAAAITAIGVIAFTACEILEDVFKLEASFVSYTLLAVALIVGIAYVIHHKITEKKHD